MIVSVGVALQLVQAAGAIPYSLSSLYSGTVNFRMIGVPSIVLDMYGDFFAEHSATYFVKISFLKPFVNASVQRAAANHHGEKLSNGRPPTPHCWRARGSPLSVSNGRHYRRWPAGLAVAVVNRLSADLPPKFVIVSSGILLQVLMNVPLTTSLLTNGAAFLFVLWDVTPRDAFEPRGQ